MWLVVGLGNPGRKYESNRHNIGFRVVDELARRHDFSAFRNRLGGDVAEGWVSLGQERPKTFLQKPLEYMNNSGHAVKRLANYHDIDSPKILVVQDEKDLPFGRLRLKRSGGHGGHNGVRSMIEQLASKDFLRVRVGVGAPPIPENQPLGTQERNRRVANYLLSDFPGSVNQEVQDLINRSADAVEAVLSRGITDAMNLFNAAGDAQTKVSKEEKGPRTRPPSTERE